MYVIYRVPVIGVGFTVPTAANTTITTTDTATPTTVITTTTIAVAITSVYVLYWLAHGLQSSPAMLHINHHFLLNTFIILSPAFTLTDPCPYATTCRLQLLLLILLLQLLLLL